MAGVGRTAGPGASRELLAAGRRGGLEETLLINSKPSSKKATALQTVRVPRSNDPPFQNVAVVELSDSDTDEENLTSEDDSESEDDCTTDEVTIDNIKLPKQKGKKGKIEILDSKVNE
ncbi:hypothetical protein ASZ78_015710 [Callipepla squamata]|uniref:Uncharacterized protein n=1 Tax=Callipepla squamata TaxID=9009 RepID=A0A226NPS1_CALSU|nr:hypothetical protein ASZ78_015710 [Callipepla squamata]